MLKWYWVAAIAAVALLVGVALQLRGKVPASITGPLAPKAVA